MKLLSKETSIRLAVNVCHKSNDIRQKIIIMIQPNQYEKIIQSASVKKIGGDKPLKEIGVTKHLRVLFGSTSSYLFVLADS
ncbi:hypothetical protein D6S42_07995 [Salmonella enterica subsp. enterica serovar Kottbus]|nr:hypothetical protein [Salmonella enterica subsp. enterica serovar Thompson]EBY8710975.1 hypothetical protein [Salmonella enterica subsp. enterica serovar Kottbus]